MKKSLNQIDGTIANYLVKHKDEIWACGNDTTKMKQTVLNLLKSKELEHNSHTSEAIKRFDQTTSQNFAGMLTTYMLGSRVI